MTPLPCARAARSCCSPLTSFTCASSRGCGQRHSAPASLMVLPASIRRRRSKTRCCPAVSSGRHSGTLMRPMRRSWLVKRIRPQPTTTPMACAAGSGSAAKAQSSQVIRRARIDSVASVLQTVGIIGSEVFPRFYAVFVFDLQLDPAHRDVVEPVGLPEDLVLAPARYAFGLATAFGDIGREHIIEGGDSDELHDATVSG